MGLSGHKSFWYLAVEIPEQWLRLPTPSTNLILIQSQKRILRPTGSSTWGKFWERSPCISLTFTLLVDDHLYKKSGWVQSLSSQQCLQDPVWEYGPWETSVLMHFLTPASGAMRSCSPCGWSQCDVQGLPYYIWYFLCKNRGHKRACTYVKQYFHSLQKITSNFLYSFYPFTCGSQEWLLLSGLLEQMVLLQSCWSAGRTMVSYSRTGRLLGACPGRGGAA